MSKERANDFGSSRDIVPRWYIFAELAAKVGPFSLYHTKNSSEQRGCSASEIISGTSDALQSAGRTRVFLRFRYRSKSSLFWSVASQHKCESSGRSNTPSRSLDGAWLAVTFVAVGDDETFWHVRDSVPPEHLPRIKCLGQRKDIESIAYLFTVGVLATGSGIHGRVFPTRLSNAWRWVNQL
jgi:hypothetical protein